MSGDQTSETRPLIGITMGDPLGIGPEVVVKALADDELRRRARYVVFGLHEALELAADQAEINPFWWREPFEHGPRVATGVLVADFDDVRTPRVNGVRGPDALAGNASFRFVDEGIRHLREGAIDALVTAPICKESWVLAKHHFRGHTDLLAHRFNTRRVTMAFFTPRLRVALASTHIPLFELRNHFTIGLVYQPIDLLSRALQEWYGIERPRIAVLGLNPHAGESGLLGDDEQRVIEPALAMAHNAGLRVFGPLAPDNAFTPETLERYDGFVAMYHDQGLIPVKMLSFHEAVNVTLGLERIRTSPDHGTAFDIAGKNVANAGSMRAAIARAIDYCRVDVSNISAAASTLTHEIDTDTGQSSTGP
ncbi:MAG: 4-hydroxythreonine-4-phosphate dehydrogenase PdxA [Phycisphaerae bacterium]|nr:4-hydroxythreonine-4-phosphate dehydrogenase PdxA [Phycisphaerae bacterium]